MYRDHETHTEADAGAYDRAHAEPYDDRPSLSDLEPDDFRPPRNPGPLTLTCMDRNPDCDGPVRYQTHYAWRLPRCEAHQIALVTREANYQSRRAQW